MEEISENYNDSDLIDRSESSSSGDEYCSHCASVETLIQETVIIWLDQHGADLLSQIFVPKKVSPKKRKLNK